MADVIASLDATGTGRHFDVFVSYAHEDADWVRVLAGRLHQAGLEVFLDDWQIVPGDVLVRSLEEGIRTSTAGILVCSPSSVASSWVMQEYAALLTQAVTQGRRLIPVLFEQVELPAFLAARVWVDFRHADGPTYDVKLTELVRALRATPPADRPGDDQALLVPPGTGFRPEGVFRACLTAGPDHARLTDPDQKTVVQDTLGAGTDRLATRMREWERTRRASGSAVMRQAPAAAVRSPVQQSLLDLGMLLGEVFTPGPVGEALNAQTADAHRHRAALRLQIAATDAVADLPWETLIPPGATAPVALDPSIEIYRVATVPGPAPGIQIPGPLRILVVLASPEGDDGGPLLDVEHELAVILDALQPARTQARAYVQVLNTGTLAGIGEALKAQRFHVLHISCHANPHELLLEDERGRPDPVTAEQLIEAIPAERSPAVVVLAGCSTALSRQVSVQDSATVLPGLARELLAGGIPQVVAMTAPITDRYAALFGGRLYRELALAAQPSVVSAVARARRLLERDRQALPAEHRDASLVEWATPVVFVRGEPQPLYDPRSGMEQLSEPTAPTLTTGIPLRAVGDFVGRRAELRSLGAVLRRAEQPGVLLHGIGGVGKSSLAAELLRLSGADTGLIVSVVGATSADQILEAFGRALFTAALAAGLPDTHPDRQLAAYLRTPGEPWQNRLGTALSMLTGRPVMLLIDNFETNLDPQPDRPAVVLDDTLASFLAGWIRTPGTHRVLITSRYPFPLPDNAHRRLTTHHLGPLSLAETRKLIWRLPGLDNLTPTQQERAWADVGGHPRTLEYLDALLRKGQARFADVTERLETLLTTHGVPNPEQWITDLHNPTTTQLPGGEELFGRALAEAITLTVNDTLLNDLTRLLDEPTLTLLLGAAVYRRPTDQLALAWQTSPPLPIPDDPDRDARITQAGNDIRAAERAGQPTGLDQLGYPPGHLAALERDLAQLRRPPLAQMVIDRRLTASLQGLGLLTPVLDQDDTTTRYVVHRWTAGALARLHPDATTRAHALAADYFTWRVERLPQDPIADLYDRIEARYHRHTGGDLKAAVSLSYAIGDQLDGWAAWDWETSICRETLTWVDPGSYDGASFTHQLGNLAHHTGDYPEAERRYQQALATFEELGDLAGAARIYHQLGILAQDRGDYPQAERHYRQSLAIKEDLDNRAGTATTYHQLGNLAFLTGDYGEAERRYQQSLTIDQDRGNLAGTATSYHQLGMLAQARGDYDEAGHHYQHALTMREGLGDRAGMADSYHELGNLAFLTGDYDEAERRYQHALTISEDLGNRAGVASTYGQLGMLAQARGDYDEAERRLQQSLTIDEDLGNRAGMASSYGLLGTLARNRGDYDEAERRYQQALTIDEDLGNRAGIASSYSQLGSLRTATGHPAHAVALHCRALVIRLDLQVPQSAIDLRELTQLRTALGDEAFNQAAASTLDGESIDALNQLLDQPGQPERHGD